MEARELMIGNILRNIYDEYCMVDCITDNENISVFYKDDTTEEPDMDCIFPVELSPKWLFRIGGVKESESGEYCLIVLKGSADMPLLRRTRNGWSVSIGMKLRDFEFQYVHQLQNIVKIITGCNLKIEL